MIKYGLLKLSFIWNFHIKKICTFQSKMDWCWEIRLIKTLEMVIYSNKQLYCSLIKTFLTNYISNHIILLISSVKTFCLLCSLFYMFAMILILGHCQLKCCSSSFYSAYVARGNLIFYYIFIFYIVHRNEAVNR